MDWGWERVGAGGGGWEWVGGSRLGVGLEIGRESGWVGGGGGVWEESVWVGVLYKKTGARRADDRPFSVWNYIAFAREMSN